MENINKKTLQISSPFIILFFLLPFFINWYETNFIDGILNGLVGGLIFGTFSSLFIKSALKRNIEFKWWQWFFYILGCLLLLSIGFWLILYIIHKAKDPKDSKFLNKEFYKRVYVGGLIFTILIPIGFIGSN